MKEKRKKDFFDLVELISAFEVEYMREDNQERILQLTYEILYAKLEELFYDYNIPASDIFNYYIQQTGYCRKFDIFEKWLHYLELAKQFEITDYLPKNILYSYNLALERAGLEPILYEIGPYVGFNEYFIRSSSEILIGGELPVDNDGNVVRRWILVNIENEKYMPMFLAEDVKKHMPEAAIYKDGKIEDWNYRVMIPAMFAMLKEQHEEIKELKQTVKEMMKC